MTSEEREIDLQDMIYRVLLGWRQLLVWMLAGALILGALGYRKADSAAKISDMDETLSESEAQEQEETLKEDLTDEQMENIRFVREEVKTYESMIEKKEEYCEKSILMREDPSAVPTMTLQYSIDNHYEVVYPTISSRDNMSQIQQTYQAEILSVEVYQKVADAIGEGDSSEYISEVFSFSWIDKGISITLTYIDEEGVRAMSEAVKQAVADAYEDVRAVCGDFDIVLNGETYQLNLRQDLIDTQLNVMNVLAGYKSSKTNLTAAFSEAEKEYYNLLVKKEKGGSKIQNTEETETETTEEETGEEDGGTNSGTSPMKTVVQYTLLGAIIGLFLGCCYLAFRYILAGKLYTASDVSIYGLQNLGVVPVSEGKRRPLDGVDHMLERIALGSRREMTAEKAIALAVSYMDVLLKQKQQKEVMITGTEWSEEEKNLANRLQAALVEAGFEVKLRCGLLSDEETIREASVVQNVVLLEKFGRTRFGELGREKEMLSANQLTVLGVVAVEPRLA